MRDEVVVYPVWYGTNHALADAADPAKGFATEIDPQGTTHYGRCSVIVPRSHQFGSLGTPSWKMWTRFQFEDDRLRLHGARRFPDGASFFAETRRELAARGENQRQVLIYLHGDNLLFEEAALRTAQIGFDLGVPGLTAFFSWPSYASESGYLSYNDRIAVSEYQIANFLTCMARITPARNVHILIHAIDSPELARTLQRIVAETAFRSNLQFGRVILAAGGTIEVSRAQELAKSHARGWLLGTPSMRLSPEASGQRSRAAS